MSKKKQPQKRGFWQKLRTRYKLSFFREHTLEEVWTIHLSRLGAILLSILLVVIIGVGITSFIIGTPIRNLLPGYLKNETRAQLVDYTLRVDSLNYQMQLQERYLDNIAAILNGDITTDSLAVPTDSTHIWSPDILKEASAESKTFAKEYEQDERFTLNTLRPHTEGLLFYPPVRGTIVKNFSPEEGQYGIEIQTSRQSAVSSVLDGTVVSVSYTIEHGYVIVVQHNNNFISIYRNNAQSFRRVGESVAAGEKIAITGSYEEGNHNNVAQFELWYIGTPLNPVEYIVF